MKEYRCILRTFWHDGLRNPGDIVLCDPAEMKDNRCFELVEPDPKPAPELSQETAQPKKTTAKKVTK